MNLFSPNEVGNKKYWIIKSIILISFIFKKDIKRIVLAKPAAVEKIIGLIFLLIYE